MSAFLTKYGPLIAAGTALAVAIASKNPALIAAATSAVVQAVAHLNTTGVAGAAAVDASNALARLNQVRRSDGPK